MSAIALVAGAVYRESVRDRVPLTIAGFGVLMVAAQGRTGPLTTSRW